jgi:signal transduction histidine kinase
MVRRIRWFPSVLRSVRMRTTVASALVVACALVIGGIGFVILLTSSLSSSVEDTAQQRAGLVVRALEAGSNPRQLADHGDEEMFVQIAGAHNRLLANSDPKLTGPVLPSARNHGVTIDHLPIDDGTHSFRVVTAEAALSGRTLLVIAGASLEHVTESTRAVTRMLLYGIPGLLVLVVLTTWLFTGRALRPVEMVRRKVADISSEELEQRVPVPETGDEIARLAETMNEMLNRLSHSSLRQRHFISDASHELRSPLASIRHHAEIAAQHPETTSLEELVMTILHEEKRLEGLVDDLLLLARADEHTLALARNPIDLDDLVFEEAARVRTSSKLQVDTSRVSAARILGDRGSLRRVLRNVADNAMRHARTRISFEVSSLGGTASVVVVDDGDGIPKEDRGRIFERFTRLEDARDRDSGGSGLGLSIVAEIMTAHAGSVTVGEGGGSGARFELRLPALGTATR